MSGIILQKDVPHNPRYRSYFTIDEILNLYGMRRCYLPVQYSGPEIGYNILREFVPNAEFCTENMGFSMENPRFCVQNLIIKANNITIISAGCAREIQKTQIPGCITVAATKVISGSGKAIHEEYILTDGTLAGSSGVGDIAVLGDPQTGLKFNDIIYGGTGIAAIIFSAYYVYLYDTYAITADLTAEELLSILELNKSIGGNNCNISGVKCAGHGSLRRNSDIRLRPQIPVAPPMPPGKPVVVINYEIYDDSPGRSIYRVYLAKNTATQIKWVIPDLCTASDTAPDVSGAGADEKMITFPAGDWKIEVWARNSYWFVKSFLNITIGSVVLPKASFTASTYNTPKPGYITFRSTSQRTDRLLWNFGDGTTSTNSEVQHIYRKHGKYTITLYVWNAYGQDILQVPECITIRIR